MLAPFHTTLNRILILLEELKLKSELELKSALESRESEHPYTIANARRYDLVFAHCGIVAYQHTREQSAVTGSQTVSAQKTKT